MSTQKLAQTFARLAINQYVAADKASDVFSNLEKAFSFTT